MKNKVRLIGIIIISLCFIVGCSAKGPKYKISDQEQYQIEYDYVIDEQVPEYGALDMMLTSIDMATSETDTNGSVKDAEYDDLVFAKMSGTIDSLKRENTKENRKTGIDTALSMVDESKKADAKKLANEIWNTKESITSEFEKIRNSYDGKAINKEIYRDLKSKVDTYNSKLENMGAMMIGGAIQNIFNYNK